MCSSDVYHFAAARNGETVVPITVVPESSPAQRTPSPSSSGIVADMDNVAEENKVNGDLGAPRQIQK